EHQLVVVARSPEAAGNSRGIKVVRAQKAPPPVLHVLPIGIDKYENKDLTLAFAAKDAKDLCAAFHKSCKGPLFGDVTGEPLLDQDATRAGVLQAVKTLRKAV